MIRRGRVTDLVCQWTRLTENCSEATSSTVSKRVLGGYDRSQRSVTEGPTASAIG